MHLENCCLVLLADVAENIPKSVDLPVQVRCDPGFFLWTSSFEPRNLPGPPSFPTPNIGLASDAQHRPQRPPWRSQILVLALSDHGFGVLDSLQTLPVTPWTVPTTPWITLLASATSIYLPWPSSNPFPALNLTIFRSIS